jgi:hypothetical protein
MTTTDYVPVDALKSYIEHFIEESEKQQARAVEMFNPDDASYYDGVIDALKAIKERIDEMKVSI